MPMLSLFLSILLVIIGTSKFVKDATTFEEEFKSIGFIFKGIVSLKGLNFTISQVLIHSFVLRKMLEELGTCW